MPGRTLRAAQAGTSVAAGGAALVSEHSGSRRPPRHPTCALPCAHTTSPGSPRNVLSAHGGALSQWTPRPGARGGRAAGGGDCRRTHRRDTPDSHPRSNCAQRTCPRSTASPKREPRATPAQAEPDRRPDAAFRGARGDAICPLRLLICDVIPTGSGCLPGASRLFSPRRGERGWGVGQNHVRGGRNGAPQRR